MTDVTRILSAIEQGDPHAAGQLLPLVYDELRKLAAQRLAQERRGQPLQATALVHEAYVRLVGADQARHWDGRGHFFAAAAEAMRRILIDQARRKQSQKRGGSLRRVELDAGAALAAPEDFAAEELLALDEALPQVEADDPPKARPVKARFLARPALAGATADEPAGERPGAVVGPYKLLEQIGEGGFGVVFMAEQQRPLRRKVALKVLKPGMDTRQVVARFEAERQALALMDHPNIAQVHDGGATPSGRQYFVMELVKGVPITEFCDQNHLTPRQRLGLFADVCRAVQHAHQKGVIHRDLKPSNVLVTVVDGQPVPKIIDFGLAKVIGRKPAEGTLLTQVGVVVGTPDYMSPEQADPGCLDIDTRS